MAHQSATTQLSSGNVWLNPVAHVNQVALGPLSPLSRKLSDLHLERRTYRLTKRLDRDFVKQT